MKKRQGAVVAEAVEAVAPPVGPEDEPPRRDHVLAGLDGSNLLAFLAAVGTLRTWTGIAQGGGGRLSWSRVGSRWSPTLHLDEEITGAELLQRLDAALSSGRGSPAFSLATAGLLEQDNLTLSAADFSRVAESASTQATPTDRAFADFCAAWGTDAYRSKDAMVDTAFRTMSGAGHQHFLAFMRQLVDTTAVAHLRRALFEKWRYEDERPSMRWDAHDDRRYALRARDPSADVIRTVRGANRLALEAMPYLPTVPRSRGPVTSGFRRGSRAPGIEYSWPLWNVAAGADAVRTLLNHAELVVAEPRAQVLGPIGVVEVMRTRRITVDRYRNFTPARPVLR
ncbi:MAG: hypothetical protein HUU15_01195 [Candidatus Brocadiae bacterium]|nr:hypothetical protein [Myxococcota bacterium]NUN47428.1 hypothetical protein [Candidatus Brocadiia bacterium]